MSFLSNLGDLIYLYTATLMTLLDFITDRFKPHPIALDPKDANLDLRGKNVLVTGGTNGIGAAIAVAYARRGANLYIAGRNPDAAAKVLESARIQSEVAGRYSPKQVFEFCKFDASLKKDCIRFADELAKVFADRGGLHFLIMTQGGMGNGTRKETEEGHEWFLALHDFSRYITAVKLLPALKQSGAGVILDVLAAAVWNRFDENNLELIGQSPDFPHVAARDGQIHDVFTLEFKERCPEIKYNHLYPGPVKSDITSSNDMNPVIAWGFNTVTHLLGQSPESYSEVAFKIGTTWYREATQKEPCRFWGGSGEERHVKEYPQRPNVRAKVMEFMEQETGLRVERSQPHSTGY